MTKAEDELIRDRFVIGIRDDKQRGDSLHRRKEGRSVFTLEEVIRKAKASEASARLNAHVIESQRTTEQVNFTKNVEKTPSRSTDNCSRCGYCGGREHARRPCPAAKPGIYCHTCGGKIISHPYVAL